MRRKVTGDLPIWAMIETPRGVLNAREIAAAPGMSGFVMGTNDLAKELGCRSRARPPAADGLAADRAARGAERRDRLRRRGLQRLQGRGRVCAPNASRAAIWGWTARR